LRPFVQQLLWVGAEVIQTSSQRLGSSVSSLAAILLLNVGAKLLIF